MNIRVALADDPELGAGNVLMKLREHGAAADRPGITFDVGVDGHPAWAPLSFGELCDRVATRAAWLYQQGIKPRDPVAVYATSAADCLLTFMALNWVGAIPALMNGNMPGETAVEYIRRLRATAVLTDGAHRSLLDGRDLGGATVADVAEAGTGNPVQAPGYYRYADDDPR